MNLKQYDENDKNLEKTNKDTELCLNNNTPILKKHKIFTYIINE